jgi:hypothetical protein
VLVQASATILHSRAITFYKSCGPALSLETCLARHKQGEADLRRALHLARKTGAENPSNIITSLGILYFSWAEREREEGNLDQWQEMQQKVEQTLREGLQERPDNAFAAFGLAKYLLSQFDNVANTGPVTRAQAGIGAYLAEALELLQREPESYFADEWDEVHRRAIARLEGPDAQRVIEALKGNQDELGYALEALRYLDGGIPSEPTTEPDEVVQMRQAGEVLRAAGKVLGLKRCPLADLLRYALFSADMERLERPALKMRFDLLERLRGTIYLDQPIWLFDYAMLAFQVGHYDIAAETFARLRKGQRFFEVPRERSEYWKKSPDSRTAMPVVLRILSAGGSDEKGWGRIENPPIRFRDPVPFSPRVFRSRGKNVRVGNSTTCYIVLNPSGPFAEPEAR